MKPFPVPVVGAGSQPDDEPLQVLAAPGAMETFRMPAPRSAASPQALERARGLLSRLLAQMQANPFVAADMPALDLAREPAEVVEQVNELLGQGEVSCRVAGPRHLRIQESGFAAIWRVQEWREDGTLTGDRVETGAIPRALREVLDAPDGASSAAPEPGPGVMNAPALLHEILQASTAAQGARVINLTLLPVTPQDLDYLAAALGAGPVTLLSRGYGNCRIASTAVPRVWWVQYFNAMDQLILNTVEVVDIPEVALAAREDYEDSRERLAEWIATLES
jgi:hydrogenase-1 operon protein HyaF